MRLLASIFLLICFCCCSIKPPPPKFLSSTPKELSHIQLPDGFAIEYFMRDVSNAREMTRAAGGTIFVGTRNNDKVFALLDRNQDGKPDSLMVIAEDLFMPNGVAMRGGDLYVAEVNRIIKFPNIEARLPKVPKIEVVYDQFPSEKHHGWKYIDFEPGGERLWVPVGAPCNICESEDSIFATITSMRYDGTDLRIEAHGVRNSVGFDWHPKTGAFYFTDNGRDWMGDDLPPCELNYLSERGQHFGYPFCHGDTIPDPELANLPCSQYQAPIEELGAHVAPLGVLIHTGKSLPKEYHNQVFIAEHGSWNRSTRNGYRISVVPLDAEGKATDYKSFATGWEIGEKVSGRPVALLELPDGSILVSDDYADVIYRIYYTGGEGVTE